MMVRTTVLMSIAILTSFALQALPGGAGTPRADEGMGRSVRTEASIQYLRSRYGEDPSRWPCDQQLDVGIPLDQVRAGKPPIDSQGARRMRDRAN